jgi:N-acyl-phosphatidylethanolamine-hydrolysing phospholipase D
MLPPDDFIYPHIEQKSKTPYTLNWIGHATFLIQTPTATLLTDPIWSERASLFGPKRKMPPAIKLEELPRIDAVLISHNHYDHLDTSTLYRLCQKFPELVFYVPLGLKNWFLKKKIHNQVIELDWWQHAQSKEMTVHAVPSQHWSARSLFNQNETLWCGYVVEFGNKKLYFTGDTGYNSIDFQQIGDRFKSIDVSMIPIGDYIPRRFMQPVHNSPEEAVCIHKDVRSKLSVACHFATFDLSYSNMKLPPYDLFQSQQKHGVSLEEFLLPIPGKTIYW